MRSIFSDECGARWKRRTPSLQSIAADLQNVQLVLTAELAADYFTLRELDAEFNVVQESVGYERKGLDLVNNRHEGGIANGLEVAQQATVLDATVSQLALVQESRAQYEHAIAVLIGQSASNLNVRVAPLQATPPPVPLGVPSDVLERRPDIAYAERQMAYQNAQVGIARTAFYPHITLSGAGGWQSSDIASLLNAPSLFWSLGADALEPIFEGGRNRANLAAARAAYDQSVANYRQSVLTAFQASRGRHQQSEHAVASARHATCRGGRCPPRARNRQQSLRRRRYNLSRRHHRANHSTYQRTAGDAVARASRWSAPFIW